MTPFKLYSVRGHSSGALFGCLRSFFRRGAEERALPSPEGSKVGTKWKLHFLEMAIVVLSRSWWGSIQSHTSALFHLLEERPYSSLFLMNNQSDIAGFDYGFSLSNVAG